MKFLLIVCGLCVGFQVVVGLWFVFQGWKGRRENAAKNS
jgi:hypothetical protein